MSLEREKVVIRNFIYLDSDKLRSLSSQLFEGIAEHVVHISSESKSASEDQKGPFSSGRLLGEIFAQERSTSELQFLEDHAYTIFEDKLRELDFIDEVTDESIEVKTSKSFVKITTKVQFNDLKASHEITSQYNEIGEALWRVGNESMAPDPIKKILSDGEARKRAGDAGLQMNKKVSDAAATLIEFGFKDLLEINMEIGGRLYSAPLKREFLRENENMIIHKYSRFSACDFTLLGIPTQHGQEKEKDPKLPDVKDADGMKEAMRALAYHIRTIEDSFVGPSLNESVIDPVAIYSVI